MTKFGVGSTSNGAAFCRAVEQYLPENARLFNDAVVYDLMSGYYQWMLRSPRIRQYIIDRTEASTKGLYGAQVCRTRYIDEVVTAALKKNIRQIVILGAGIDTRAYRLPGMAQAQIFELDMPRVQKAKKARVAKYLGGVPENVRFVPFDFEEQDLGDVLKDSCFDPAQPAVFIWEAVTQYLTASAVARTLRFIGSCARSSRVVFTYVLRWIIEHPERDREAMALIKLAKLKMAPFIFGLESTELPDYLKDFHLRVIEDVGNEYYQKNWLEPMERKLDVTYGERTCLAEVI